MDLKLRSYEPEIMDDLELSGEVIPKTLRELDVINRWLGGNQISLLRFRKLLQTKSIHSVADLGCGGGDIMIAMAKLADKKGVGCHFTGFDANQHIVDYARHNTQEFDSIEVQCENIFNLHFQQQSFDVIHCCLFLHHFTHEQLVGLFRSFLKQTGVAIIVNDLHRHPIAYYSIKVLTRLFSRSFMVRNDAPVSVARGFKRIELEAIMKESGVSNYTLKWNWAFRWELVIDCQTHAQ